MGVSFASVDSPRLRTRAPTRQPGRSRGRPTPPPRRAGRAVQPAPLQLLPRGDGWPRSCAATDVRATADVVSARPLTEACVSTDVLPALFAIANAVASPPEIRRGSGSERPALLSNEAESVLVNVWWDHRAACPEARDAHVPGRRRPTSRDNDWQLRSRHPPIHHRPGVARPTRPRRWCELLRDQRAWPHRSSFRTRSGLRPRPGPLRRSGEGRDGGLPRPRPRAASSRGQLTRRE